MVPWDQDERSGDQANNKYLFKVGPNEDCNEV